MKIFCTSYILTLFDQYGSGYDANVLAAELRRRRCAEAPAVVASLPLVFVLAQQVVFHTSEDAWPVRFRNTGLSVTGAGGVLPFTCPLISPTPSSTTYIPLLSPFSCATACHDLSTNMDGTRWAL